MPQFSDKNTSSAELQKREKQLRAILAEAPQHLSARNNLAAILIQKNDYLAAIKLLQQLVADQPDYIDAWYNLGLAFKKIDQFANATSAFTTLIALAPDHLAARFHLGCVTMAQKKFQEAISIFLNILEKQPNHAETHANLAGCYLQLNDLAAAKKHYLFANTLTPNDPWILFNLGVTTAQLGDIDQAIQYYQHVTQLDPQHFAAHNNLGVAFLTKQQPTLALEHFQKALELQPSNHAIDYIVTMLMQKRKYLKAPTEYIATLFDAYADHYEPHLLHALDYQIPTIFLKALAHVTALQPHKIQWDSLDLGCGTGLCGALLKPYVRTLTGVDLSEKMLAQAAQKNCYDLLEKSDLLSFLINKKENYDLILAGDVFVYLGDLDSIFKAIWQALRHQGLLIFNTEITTTTTDFRMQQSGRFSHAKKYLDSLAKKYHFQIAYHATITSRQQQNKPVPGYLYVLKK